MENEDLKKAVDKFIDSEGKFEMVQFPPEFSYLETVTEIKILRNDYVHNLEPEINRYLSDGWNLHGGIIALQDSMIQVMAREVPKK
jgi:hypothetical protein